MICPECGGKMRVVWQGRKVELWRCKKCKNREPRDREADTGFNDDIQGLHHTWKRVSEYLRSALGMGSG